MPLATQHYTLVYPVFKYPVDQTLVLLGLQKSGKWYNYLNGFGGKVENNEGSHAGARRELKEETGIIAAEGDLILHGKIRYKHENLEVRQSSVYVYLYENWDGDFPKGGELEGNLFPIQAKSLPFEKMPPHDNIWLPRILNGEFVEATLTYETTHRDEDMLKCVEFVNIYEKPSRY